MDKNEYQQKTEEMLELLDDGAYSSAAMIADEIDWRRVKNASMLSSVSDIYELNGEVKKSYDILKIAYERSAGGRKVVYRLGELALQLGRLNDAIEYYTEFVEIAPKDPNQYILRYQILRKRNAPIEEQIETLEEFKKAEYIERWAYELAKLYQEAGMVSECLEECDDLILWFSEGTYVYHAMELKMQYKPLTPSQLEKYNHRFDQKTYDADGNTVQFAAIAPSDTETELEPDKEPTVAQRLAKAAQLISEEPERSPEELEAAMNDESPIEEIPDPEESSSPKRSAIFSATMKLGEALDNLIHGSDDEAESEDAEEESPIEEEPFQSETKISEQAEQVEEANSVEEPQAQKVEAMMDAPTMRLPDTDEILAKMKEQNQEKAAETAKRPLEEAQITGQLNMADMLNDWEDNAKAAIKEAPKSAPSILPPDIQKMIDDIENGVMEEPIQPEEVEEVKEPEQYENMGQTTEDLRIDDSEDDYEEDDMEEDVVEEPVEEVVEEDDDEDDYEEVDEADYDEAEYEEDDEADYDEDEFEEADEDDYDEDEYEEADDYDEFEDEDYDDEDEFEDEDDYDEDEFEDEDYDDEDEFEDEDYDDEDEFEDEDYDDEDEFEDEDYDDEDEFEDEDYDDEDEFEDEDYDDEDEFEDEDYDDEDEEFENPDLEEKIVAAATAAATATGRARAEAQAKAAKPELDDREIPDDDIPDLLTQTAPLSRKETAKLIATGKTAPLPVDEISNAISMSDTGFIVHGRYDLETQSGIGTRAGLTDDQKKLFSYFVPVRGMSEQLVDVLEQDKNCTKRNGTSRTGNLVIIGRKGSGKTVLAVDVVKAIQKQRKIKQGKVAIVTGDALNKKRVSEILSKLYGGALIIEKAGKMNEKTVARLNKAMEGDTGELLIVLEEQRKPLDRLLTSNKEFRRKFTSRLEVPIFINDELVTFGQTYARENGYRIDEMGILALYSRIDALQREDHAVTVAEVKEIMDEAQEHSKKTSAKKLVKRVFGKSTDETDRIILTEKDFNI